MTPRRILKRKRSDIPLLYEGKLESQKANFSTSVDSLFHIIFYPPVPTPTRSSYLHQERLWTYSLVQLENSQIRLQTLNAYIATLGGGCFLCHYLSTAVQLARSQRKVALALGDWSLALKCTLNEAYNFIYAGHISVALGLIRHVKIKAKTLIREEDRSLILSMCKSARWVAKKVLLVGAQVQSKDNDKAVEEVGTVYERRFNGHDSLKFDDLHRVRVVRDRLIRM